MKNKKIQLKILNASDVSIKYLKWLNNSNIMKFTAQAGKRHSLSSVKKFVKEKRDSKIEYLYGIYIFNDIKKIKEHIGNIKLGPINKRNLTADVSYIIGEKKYWNKGYATQAVKEITILAKKKFKLKKLQAGHQKINSASSKVLTRNKFKLEGIFKSQIKIGKNKRTDRYVYGLIL